METVNEKNHPHFKELKEKGYLQMKLEFPSDFAEDLKNEYWSEVDQKFARYLEEDGFLRKFLNQFHPYDTTEHMIAIRDAKIDEDGIWHDDGSRHFAFTWSFNDDPNLEGGELLFKEKGSSDCVTISPPPYETLTVFLTGQYHFEHKVNKVLRGVRKTLVGWCSSHP